MDRNSDQTKKKEKKRIEFNKNVTAVTSCDGYEKYQTAAFLFSDYRAKT